MFYFTYHRNKGDIGSFSLPPSPSIILIHSVFLLVALLMLISLLLVFFFLTGSDSYQERMKERSAHITALLFIKIEAQLKKKKSEI